MREPLLNQIDSLSSRVKRLESSFSQLEDKLTKLALRELTIVDAIENAIKQAKEEPDERI